MKLPNKFNPVSTKTQCPLGDHCTDSIKWDRNFKNSVTQSPICVPWDAENVKDFLTSVDGPANSLSSHCQALNSSGFWAVTASVGLERARGNKSPQGSPLCTSNKLWTGIISKSRFFPTWAVYPDEKFRIFRAKSRRPHLLTWLKAFWRSAFKTTTSLVVAFA